MSATLHIYLPLHSSCSLHIDPTLMLIKVKIQQQTVTIKCHANAIYVTETNKPLKFHTCHICKLVHYADRRKLCQYICIIWAKCNQQCDQSLLVCIHFTLLSYAPQQICLPHCIYISHHTPPVVYI